MIDDAEINARLEAVLESILCPIAGCWSFHGCHYECYYDNDAEAYVLEAWPVAVDEPVEVEGNGHSGDEAVRYELAEFDFTELGKQIPLEHFHFSQRRSIFEIAWQERGQQLELRVHIVPMEVDED
jgi:hypothetical protein